MGASCIYTAAISLVQHSLQTSSMMMDDLVCGLTLALQWRAAAAAVAPDAAACGGRVGGGGACGDAAQASKWSGSPACSRRCCAVLALSHFYYACHCRMLANAAACPPARLHSCLPAARVPTPAASTLMARRRCTTPWRCRQALTPTSSLAPEVCKLNSSAQPRRGLNVHLLAMWRAALRKAVQCAL